MFKIIKSVIENKEFKLEDILYKINKMYMEDILNEEEKNELDNLARSKAKMENSYNLQKQLDEIFGRLEKLEKNVSTNGEEMAEEYPEFKQPSGAHDSFKSGDKVTFNGQKYICQLDNCVWSPITYPQGWKEVTEVV